MCPVKRKTCQPSIQHPAFYDWPQSNLWPTFALDSGLHTEVPDRDAPVGAVLDHCLVLAAPQSSRPDVLLTRRHLLRQDPRGVQLDPVPTVRSSRCLNFLLRGSPSGHCLEYAWLGCIYSETAANTNSSSMLARVEEVWIRPTVWAVITRQIRQKA